MTPPRRRITPGNAPGEGPNPGTRWGATALARHLPPRDLRAATLVATCAVAAGSLGLLLVAGVVPSLLALVAVGLWRAADVLADHAIAARPAPDQAPPRPTVRARVSSPVPTTITTSPDAPASASKRTPITPRPRPRPTTRS